MKNIKTLLIIFTALVIGCNPDDPINSSNTSIDSTKNIVNTIDFNVTGRIIPLKLHNTWSYIDSNYIRDSLTVYKYTVTVDSFYLYNSDTIWVLIRRDEYYYVHPFTVGEYKISNDSIYSKGVGENGIYVSLDYLLPAGNDTVRYYSLAGGDISYQRYAVKLANGFHTIHGIVNNCVKISNLTNGFEVFKPGIGMIYAESNFPESNSYRRKHLVNALFPK